MTQKLDAEHAPLERQMAERHSDQAYDKNGVSIRFVWDPFLNSSSLAQQLRPGPSTPPMPPTAILVIGGGLWQARYLQEDALSSFTMAMNNVFENINRTRDIIHHPWDTLKVVAPVQLPHYELLSEERKRTITPQRVEDMNAHLLRVTEHRTLPIAWAFSAMLSQQPKAYDESGLHAMDDVADRMVDVLLNVKCNAKSIPAMRFPMDRTCCVRYPTPSWMTQLFLTASSGLLGWFLLPARYQKKFTPFPSYLPPQKVLTSISVLCIAVSYSYFADRTQLWMKNQKQFDIREFAVFGVLLLAIGMITIRRSKGTSLPQKHSSVTEVRDEPFLSRDQTDEWKGWMQLIILAYHYTGASHQLSIYELVRLLVAAYLFMTGFGHALFFQKKRDYSFRRVASVLCRLNLLSILLPYVMDTNYMAYYFAPLTSFWYLVVFWTMYIGRVRNHSLRFVTGKICLSAAIVNTIIRTPRIFQDVFHVLEKLFAIRWDVDEWRFRLTLDSYIVYVGMFCGLVSVRLTQSQDIGVRNGFTDLEMSIRRHFERVRYAATVLALVAPLVFTFLVRGAEDKVAYNSHMPYASAFPILSFVVLRNSFRPLRNYYSTAFAWVGQVSLETFTLQFHIWLASDTKAILGIGIPGRWGGRRLDFLISSLIFLWMSRKVSLATQTVVAWVIEPDTNHDGDDQEKLSLSINRVKSKEDLSYAMRVVDSVRVSSAGDAMGWIAKDLRVRMMTLLILLWLLNLVRSMEILIYHEEQLTRSADLLN